MGARGKTLSDCRSVDCMAGRQWRHCAVTIGASVAANKATTLMVLRVSFLATLMLPPLSDVTSDTRHAACCRWSSTDVCLRWSSYNFTVAGRSCRHRSASTTISPGCKFQYRCISRSVVHHGLQQVSYRVSDVTLLCRLALSATNSI